MEMNAPGHLPGVFRDINSANGDERMSRERYVVFDTETPNSYNNRMCQIGVSVIEDGRILGSFTRLVNPECDYAAFNVLLHGITPEATNGEPCFAELWEQELAGVFDEGVLVAHNAPFDMAVLAKCLRAYGITWRARAQYIDTVRMARAAFPELSNHKLDTLSYALGIDLAHHDAGSDALACAKIFLACRERGVSPGRFTREYDLLTVSTVKGGTAHV